MVILLGGCASHKQQASLPPPPPPPAAATPAVSEPEPKIAAPEPAPPPPSTVLYTETGWASWYGPHYNKRRAANGEVFDMNAMTAAHRTIPLNSVVRVTNVKTGDSALVRITDRGPFVNNRIIDLSRAAAEKLNVYRAGTALVRLEVVESPRPIQSAGRWCVQIGAFKEATEAAALKEDLEERYDTARVLQFTSPIGEQWLRVRVPQDDKTFAQKVIQETNTEVGIYLVRLD